MLGEPKSVITKLRCEGCGQVTIQRIWDDNPASEDILLAEPGEFVQRRCIHCEQRSPMQVLFVGTRTGPYRYTPDT